MPIVHFETLGCKLNQIESESACKVFSDFGWRLSVKNLTSNNSLTQNEISETRLCVVNTCTVTAKAEQKCRRTIHLLLKTFPNAVILVTGCYAQVESESISQIDERIVVLPGVKKDILADLPQKIQDENFDFSKNDIAQNAEFLKNLILKTEKFQATNRFKLSTDTFFNHSRSSIKIQDGCANNCSFCRIHIARGKPVSLDAKTVLERVQKLEESGQSEVVLTGVNLCQYKSIFPTRGNSALGETRGNSALCEMCADLVPNGERYGDFADLLEYLSENTKSIYFRISSLYPQRVDERLIEVLKKSRVRPHFHLSVQSGSDQILQAMNRPYTSSQVLAAVNALKSIYQNPFLACDIIAGFPGESEQDFQATLELCQKCSFTWIHAFPFSARPGTEAFSMKNQIPQYIARKRIQILTNFADNQKKFYVQSFVGKTVKAIVEKRQDKLVRCVTENFLHAHLNLENADQAIELSGKQINVRILGESDLPECECECQFVGF